MVTRKSVLRAPALLSACMAGSLLFGTGPVMANPFFAEIRAVYLTTEDEQDYAVELFNPGGAVVFGPVARAGFDEDWGWRATLGASAGSVEVSLNGLFFETENAVSTAYPNGNGGASLTHPEGVANVSDTNVEVARADMALDLTMLNLVAAGVITSSPQFDARVFGGFAYLDMERNLDVAYLNSTFAAETDVGRHLDIEGFGLRAGSSVTFNLPFNFRLKGHLAGELHKADQDLRLLEEDFLTGTLEAVNVDASDKISSVLPVLETSLSLSYVYDLSDRVNFELGVGYEFTNFFNVLDTRFTDNLLESALTDDRRSIGLHGWSIFLKASF